MDAPASEAPTSAATLRIVRASTLEHLKGAFRLTCAMHPETDFRHYPFNPEKAGRALGAWMNIPDRMVLLLALRGDEVVGMLGASLKDAWFSDEGFASEDFLYVRADERGSRAAFMLVREFHAWRREKGVKHWRMGVGTAHATGAACARLYEHFGARFVGGNYAGHDQGETPCAA